MTEQEIVNYNLTIETSNSVDKITTILITKNISHQIIIMEDHLGQRIICRCNILIDIGTRYYCIL